MNHTGNTAWDEMFDNYDKEHRERFPKEPMIKKFKLVEIKEEDNA